MTGQEAAHAWVASGVIAPRKTINKTRSSYGLKHVAERAMGVYISNEELIRAMLAAGYTAHQTADMQRTNSPNYLFNFKYVRGHHDADQRQA